MLRPPTRVANDILTRSYKPLLIKYLRRPPAYISRIPEIPIFTDISRLFPIFTEIFRNIIISEFIGCMYKNCNRNIPVNIGKYRKLSEIPGSWIILTTRGQSRLDSVPGILCIDIFEKGQDKYKYILVVVLVACNIAQFLMKVDYSLKSNQILNHQ